MPGRSPSPSLSRRALTIGAGALSLSRLYRTGAQATPLATGSSWLIGAATLGNELGDEALNVVTIASKAEFVTGHVPGSVHGDWPVFELADSSSEEALAKWRRSAAGRLGRFGLRGNDDERIVVADGGTAFGARLAWVLAYLGGVRAPLLDGGLAAWIDAGLPVEAGAEDLVASTLFRGEVDDGQLATVPQVAETVGNAGVAFVDVREAEEYAAGHIPGAVNIPYTLQLQSSGVPTWRAAGQREQIYAERGVAPGNLIIPYCSTGVRSAVTWLGLRDLGFPRVSLFSGSWAEYSAYPDLPVTTGDQP